MPAGPHSFVLVLAFQSLFDHSHTLSLQTLVSTFASLSLIFGFALFRTRQSPQFRIPPPIGSQQHVLATWLRRLAIITARHICTRSQIFAAKIAIKKHFSCPEATPRALKFANKPVLGPNHPHSRGSRGWHLSEISGTQRTLANSSPTPSCARLWV